MWGSLLDVALRFLLTLCEKWGGTAGTDVPENPKLVSRLNARLKDLKEKNGIK